MTEETTTPEDMTTFMEAAIDELEAASEVAPPEIEATAPEPPEDVEATTDLESTDEVPPETDEADEIEAVEPVDQTIDAPASMSALDREMFNALPPEGQKWLTDRMKEQETSFTKKTMELADKSKTFDRLEQVLAPRRSQLAMDGMDDSTAVGQLFALSDFANQDPVGFVKYMLEARQIPLSALTESGTSETTTDPQLAAMQSKLQGFENFLSNQQTQAQQQAESAINVDIEKFSKENEYYADLESEMIPIVGALRQSNPSLSNADALAKAYKMAIATNEGVSAKIEAAKAVKAEAEKLAKAKAAADKSKRATSANVRSSGTLPAGKGKAEDIGDFIGNLVDERMTA